MHTHLSNPITGAAVHGRGTGAGATAIAGFAGDGNRDADFGGGSLYRFFQSQFKVVAQVGALADMAAPTAARATKNITENIPENIAKVSIATTCLSLHAGVTELIIAGAFLGIGKHFESNVGFLE